MKSFFTKERVIAIPWFVLSVVYFIYIGQIPASTMAGDPGPTLFPYIAGGLMLICSALLFVFPCKKSKPWLDKEGKIRLVSLYAVFVIFVVGCWAIGYTIPAFVTLYLGCTMFAKSAGEEVPLWKRVAYAAAVTVGIWFFFHVLLSCQLPRGVWRALNILPLI